MTEMMIHAAARAAQGVTGAFDWSIRHYNENKDDAMDWMNENYEAVGGTLIMIAEILQELSEAVSNDGGITFPERGTKT